MRLMESVNTACATVAARPPVVLPEISTWLRPESTPTPPVVVANDWVE